MAPIELDSTIGTPAPVLLGKDGSNDDVDLSAYRLMTRQMRDYKILLARDKSGDIAATYGVKAYPNLWMIDPQGNVASHHVGGNEACEAPRPRIDPRPSCPISASSRTRHRRPPCPTSASPPKPSPSSPVSSTS